MQRLFPNLGRSSKDPSRGGYAQYNGYDAEQGYYDNPRGYDEPAEPRGWRKVLARKSTNKRNDYRNDYDYDSYRTTVVDYPDDGYRPGAPPMLGGRPPSDLSYEDREDYARRTGDTTIPLVQRESSLSRIRHAFEDNGTYAGASAAPSASGVYAPQPQHHMSAVHDMHQPAGIHAPDMGRVESMRPEMVHSAAYAGSSGHRRRPGGLAEALDLDRDGVDHMSRPLPQRPQPPLHSTSLPANLGRTSGPRVHKHRERSAGPPRPPHAHSSQHRWNSRPVPPNPEDDDEYPVVVVVEHGKHGKKDKYYIIPGGAPVVFEDEDGNELTRVGDFSGNYRPRRPRPVIVQDQYGHEICRAGFNDDRISIGSRSHEGPSHREHRGRSEHRQRPHRSRRDYAPDHVTSHSSSRIPAVSGIYDRDMTRRPGSRPGSSRSHGSAPSVVYIDPYSNRRNPMHSSSDTLVHAGGIRQDQYDARSAGGRSHGSRDYDMNHGPSYVPRHRPGGSSRSSDLARGHRERYD